MRFEARGWILGGGVTKADPGAEIGWVVGDWLNVDDQSLIGGQVDRFVGNDCLAVEMGFDGYHVVLGRDYTRDGGER